MISASQRGHHLGGMLSSDEQTEMKASMPSVPFHRPSNRGVCYPEHPYTSSSEASSALLCHESDLGDDIESRPVVPSQSPHTVLDVPKQPVRPQHVGLNPGARMLTDYPPQPLPSRPTGLRRHTEVIPVQRSRAPSQRQAIARRPASTEPRLEVCGIALQHLPQHVASPARRSVSGARGSPSPGAHVVPTRRRSSPGTGGVIGASVLRRLAGAGTPPSSTSMGQHRTRTVSRAVSQGVVASLPTAAARMAKPLHHSSPSSSGGDGEGEAEVVSAVHLRPGAAAAAAAATKLAATKLAAASLGPSGALVPWKEGVMPPAVPFAGDASVGVLYDEIMEQHMGPAHFEQPLRVVRLMQELQGEGLSDRTWHLNARKATNAELLLAHTMQHIQKVDGMFEARGTDQRDAAFIPEGSDLYICSSTADAARFAAGCCIEAVQEVLSGHVSSGLAVVRPPGHHAECDRAMGFCFFNNCAVAALVALEQPGVNRVVVLDWDVHHGNGIQHVLEQNPRALYISIHRDPSKFYPFTSGFVHEVGTEEGRGFNINIPWYKKGAGDADYMAAFDLVVEPVLHSYQPDVIIVAAGFDAADGDPLGGCKMTPEGYARLTRRLMSFADGKLVLALEGGYNTGITAECAAMCVRSLLGEALPPVESAAELWPNGELSGRTLRDVFSVHSEFWPCLAERSFDDQWDAYLQEVEASAQKLATQPC